MNPPSLLPCMPVTASRAFSSFALLAASVLVPLSVHAQQADWTGAVDSAWATPGNWSPSGSPGGGELTFGAASGYTVNLGGVARPVDGAIFNSATAYLFEAGGSGGELQFSAGTGITQSGAGAVTFAADVAFLGSSTRAISGTGAGSLTFSGKLTRSSGDFNLTGTHEIILAGATVNALGNGRITIGGGTGSQTTVTLSKTTTAAQNAALGTGAITLSNGVLKVTTSDVVIANGIQIASGNGTIESDRALTLNGLLTTNASRTLTWNNTQTATVNGGVTTSGSSVGSTRTFLMAGSGDVDFNGVLYDSMDTKPLAIRKINTGTFRFSANNTYTGETAVTAGTLLINGVTTGQGSFSVTDNGTLGGTGVIGLAEDATFLLNAANAVLSPGDGGVGTLTLNGGGTNATAGLLLHAGTLVFDIAGLSSDKLVLTGFATGAGQGASTAGVGGIKVTLDGEVTTGSFELITFAANPGIALDRFALSADALAAGWDGEFRYDGNALVFDAVPEPGTWAMLVLASGMLGGWRLRRRPARG